MGPNRSKVGRGVLTAPQLANAIRRRAEDSARYRRWFGTVATAILIFDVGCASTKHPARRALTGDVITDGKNAIAYGPTKDRVLWEYRVGLAAMRRGDYVEAKRQFDEAITRIGGIYTSDAEAKKARSYFHEEAKKTFIGEPYERVMAYYYRGVLYWMDGEIDNARACFRSAQLQDADTENHEYAADYVLLDYLDGFATAKLGGEAADELQRAVKNARNTSAPPPYHKKANVMVFLEFGKGPRKIATGAHAEQLRFGEEPSPIRSVNLRLGSQQFSLVPYDDLQWQATTRGGRVMDHILANKAVFKDAMGTTAIAAGATSLGLAAHRQGEAALIAGGVAVVAGLLSATTTPEADIRAWDNLPRYLSFAALELPPGKHSLGVDFRDAGGRILVTKTVTFTVPENSPKDTVLFVSEHNT
jgi:tetratricopeptide (TPR) repeat protein